MERQLFAAIRKNGCAIEDHIESDQLMYVDMQKILNYRMSQMKTYLENLVQGKYPMDTHPVDPTVDPDRAIDILDLTEKPILGAQREYVIPEDGVIYGNSLVPLVLSLLLSAPWVNVDNASVFSPDSSVLSDLLGQYVEMSEVHVLKGQKVTSNNMSELHFAPYKAV